METFSVLLSLCAGNPPVTSGFPSQRPVTWSFDVFFAQTVEQTIKTPVIWNAIILGSVAHICVSELVDLWFGWSLAVFLTSDPCLTKSVMTYCQLDPYEESWLKFESNYFNFHSQICENIIHEMLASMCLQVYGWWQETGIYEIEVTP